MLRFLSSRNSLGFHSLRWRLPLLISVFITLVLGAFLVASYREVKSTLVRAGGERARAAAGQIASMLERSTQQGVDQLQLAADHPDVRRFLQDPTEDHRAAARAVLSRLARSASRHVGVWDSSLTTLLLDVVTPPTTSGGSPMVLEPLTPPRSTGLTPLQASGHAVFVDAVAAVDAEPAGSSAGTRTNLGYLMVRSTMAISPPGALSRLVGEDARVAIGNRSGDVWTDLAHLIPAPAAIDLSHDGIAEHRVGGEKYVGALNAIRGTVYVMWVEFPESA